MVAYTFTFQLTNGHAAEERALVKFFGDDYVDYRKRVGVMIPFIP